MKFTRAAFQIITKIIVRDNSTIIMILCCHIVGCDYAVVNESP